ncbi:MAG TPA: PilZ domain-containing protein, partial [Spirochaetia bacterium]|nr:PilZ domain-containing protein [Spirochaetia bacterium]
MLAQIVFDQEKLSQFFRDLSEGFRRSPLEVALWIALIASLVIIPTILTVIMTRREKKRRLRRARERLQNLYRRRGLDDSERALMEEMEDFFHRDKQYLFELARDPASFNAAAHRLINAGLASDEEVAQLRAKLGLVKTNPQRSVQSSMDLIPGRNVYLTLSDNVKRKGLLARVTPVGLFVTVGRSAKPQEEAMLEADLKSGRFLLFTRVLEAADGTLRLAHTEHVERVQRRRFFRRELRLPVRVTGRQTAAPLPGFIIDLSGGGALLFLREHLFKPGDQMTLAFFLPSQEPVSVHALVRRVSLKEQTL